MTAGHPRISILVLDRNGPGDLQACLSSVAEQEYPKERVQTDVVRVGSHSLGAACNRAVRASGADFVALIGSDARADPRWLAELVLTAERHSASVAASRIVNQAGNTIEFDGDHLSIAGHPFRPDPAAPSAQASGDQRLLFPGDSALFRRAAFLEAGGFDEDFLSGLEEVDLGWRLNLFAHSVVLASGALTYRSSPRLSRWELVRRRRLLERNALAMIYKNYETATLARVLPGAIALSLLRALMGSGIDTLTLAMSSAPPATANVAPELIAHLIALEDFGARLPALKRARLSIQERRRVSDRELWALFGDPLQLGAPQGPASDITAVLLNDLGIRTLVEGRERPLVAQEAISVGQNGSVPARSREMPAVSIVILTALGPMHVVECLRSLREQSYPADRIEVIVVDNNSAEDPTAAAEAAYPGVRVIRNPSNIGFAAGNNVGAAAARGDYLVFLNDDTRVQQDWLRELVATARRRGAASVASCVLDWSGRRIDFVEGAVNFQGKGFQLDYDVSIDSVALREKPLLFACGCAMLVDRAAFMDAGRWDEGTFAYYEDVELGWRLNLLGHSVWFAPAAVVYHKHHGTSTHWPEPPRIRLYERNSLRMLYEVLEPETLQRALPAALLLAADRALIATGLSRATDDVIALHALRHRLKPVNLIASAKAACVRRGVNRSLSIPEALGRLGVRGLLGVARDVLMPDRPEVAPERRAAYFVERSEPPARDQEPSFEVVPIEAAAILAGIQGFLSDLPTVSRRRSDLQARRHATDGEIVTQFGSRWCQVCPARFPLHHAARQAILIEEFALADVGDRALTRSQSPHS